MHTVQYRGLQAYVNSYYKSCLISDCIHGNTFSFAQAAKMLLLSSILLLLIADQLHGENEHFLLLLEVVNHLFSYCH